MWTASSRPALTLFVAALLASVVPASGAAAQYDEAGVRKILLDITLAGTYGYFNAHRDEPNPREALRRWDAGVRVVNAHEFERKNVGREWRHTRRGSMTDIDGMEVILTTDRRSSPSSSYDEAGVRKILLDITLARTYDYFNAHRDEPNPQEALRRWDAGVRVLNANEFERKNVRGEWRHTRRGSNSDINGMEVVLTSDRGTPASRVIPMPDERRRPGPTREGSPGGAILEFTDGTTQEFSALWLCPGGRRTYQCMTDNAVFHVAFRNTTRAVPIRIVSTLRFTGRQMSSACFAVEIETTTGFTFAEGQMETCIRRITIRIFDEITGTERNQDVDPRRVSSMILAR